MYIVYIPFPDLYTYMRICMCWPEPGSDSAFIRSAFNVALPPFCRIICGRSSAGVFRDDVAGLRLPFDPLKNQIDRLCLLRVRKRHSIAPIHTAKSLGTPKLLNTCIKRCGAFFNIMRFFEFDEFCIISTSHSPCGILCQDFAQPGIPYQRFFAFPDRS